MVKMIPDLLDAEIKSQAEVNLFYEFREHKTDQRYIILHSLGISEHVHNIFGEIDFVVICSEGVLCIEVKGGEVSCHNGVWEFINRYGKKEQKTEGPFQQVQGNMQSLRTYLLKRLGKGDPLVTCQYASCVVMPDCQFTYNGIEITPEILFDRSSYCDLDKTVALSFSYWRSKLQSQHGFEGDKLNDGEMERLANLLRGDFHFVPSMKDTIDSTSKALYSLTKEQYDVLESLADNDRTLVSGMAGTGKTLLGMEQARRVYWTGKRVIYICFNKNISEYVKYQFEKENLEIDVCTLHAVILRGQRPDNNSEEFFEQILPARFLKSEIEQEYDYLIVDEGQDLFREAYLPCLGKLIKGGLDNGCWLFFYDQNQNINNENDQLELCLTRLKHSGAASYKLSVNCRNTKQIADANSLMTGVFDTGRTKVRGPKVRYFSYKDKNEEHQILNDILLTLKNDGVSGSDLIILSRYSKSNPKNCLYNNSVTQSAGQLKTEGQMWRAKENEVRFSTIAGFKGLESKVVILMDIDGFSYHQSRLLNYVAISRACSLLYVLYDSNSEDDRQKMMVSSFENFK